MEVYSPVSSANAALLTWHSYPLVAGPCSFISHLSFLGSIQPGSHKFWRTQLITHTSLLGPTRYPLLLLGQEGVRVGKRPCPRAQHRQQMQLYVKYVCFQSMHTCILKEILFFFVHTQAASSQSALQHEREKPAGKPKVRPWDNGIQTPVTLHLSKVELTSREREKEHVRQ